MFDRAGRFPAIGPVTPAVAANARTTPSRGVRASYQADDRTWKEPSVSTTKKTKPEPADDAREQARRALQTSMDTRQ